MKNIILRGIALYIDALFIAFGTGLLFILHHFITGDLNSRMKNFESFMLFKYYFIIYFGYFVISEFFFNTTLGKRVFGFKIEYLKEDKNRCFSSILLRSFFRLIPFDQISFLFNKKHFFWHEIISCTRVIKTPK